MMYIYIHTIYHIIYGILEKKKNPAHLFGDSYLGMST